MSDIFTQVTCNARPGYAVHGRQPRAVAIAEARKHFQRQLEEAQAFLASHDSELTVNVVRGAYRSKVLETL